ncbi:MAG: hypothetical protein Q8S13_05425 [Dehalococcoidia bacterium]|nr:hypothetical protein [Dehalococcoidia bacterium]
MKQVTTDDRRASLQARLAYKPGYSFWLGRGELRIETRENVPCADQSMTGPSVTIPDAWENPLVALDMSTERGAVLATLSSALVCAIHEVLEWYSLDGTRLVSAHNTAVEEEIIEHAETLARWCWKHRREYPGAPRPEREPEGPGAA